jgi:hypothetical protein
MTHDDLEKPEETLPAAEHAAGPTAEPPSPDVAPPKRKGGPLRALALLLGVLLLLLAGGGVAAVVFKDRDARLRIVADAIESARRDPGAMVSSASAQIEGWTRELLGDTRNKVPPTSDGPRLAAPRTTAPSAFAPSTPRPVEPQRLAEAAHPAAPAPAAPAPAAAPSAPAPADPVAVPAAPVAAPEREARSAATREELAALQTQIAQAAEKSREALEAAREALEAAKEAQRAAADKTRESAEKPASVQALAEQSDNLTALDGRIDELADEIKRLRDRLDQPKETARVDAEAEPAAKPAADAQELAAFETMALSQLLAEALNHGRPFAAELGALKERGADPGLLAALAPYADHGAPTGAALLAEFAPIARSLEAQAAPAPASDSVSDGLLRILGKLVRVKGAGAPAAASVEGRIVEIEVALAHDEVSAAAEAFSSLPVATSTDAKVFGAKLKELAQARKAAADLIGGAVAGLGHLKN